MKKLSKESYNEIRAWIYRNARPLDMALFQFHFENGSKEAVISALMCYQNTDGGFGLTIDADNWNPISSPCGTEVALRTLREIDFIDLSHPIYQGILRFILDTEYKSEHGFHFTIPSNDNYPHGVWYSYNPDDYAQNVGVTASICGFILRYCESHAKLYQMANEYVRILTMRIEIETNHGDMGVFGYTELLRDLKAKGIKNEELERKVPTLLREKIITEKDNFMANPLEFIFSPESEFYDENKENVEAALDAVIDSKPENDVWNIPWEWYNEHTKSKNFAITENWWRASKAIDNLLKLRRFGRLED